MANKKTFYVTTAIDYVNAKPHVGHAFEKVLADALARWKRLNGFDVFFLTGVDENAQKNVEAAEKAGIPVKEFIDKNAASFRELCDKLNLTYNDFIRTTAKEHSVVVHKIVKRMLDKKDIYKSIYEGLYCVNCETYYVENELINGKCPEHGTTPELRKEEAYFFKLSKYKEKILKLIPKYVIPDSKANEMLSRIKENGLNDICISRKGAKWGIDFPNDKNYKIWVWIDALINYVSGLKDKEKKYWPADVHIVGKGINWFHSVIWPAILLSADYELPKTLLVHGYLNIKGQKMSKSIGNVIDPLELLNRYPSDVVRYSLLKSNVFEDSDYSEEILIERLNNELANKLGNLISRVSALAETYSLEKASPINSKPLLKKVSSHLENLEFDKALNEIFSFIDKLNELIQKEKPWETHDKKLLYQLANAIKDLAILLSPFIPETSEKIAKTFSFQLTLKALKAPLAISKIKKSEILFKKIDTTDNSSTSNKTSPKSNIAPSKSVLGDNKDTNKFSNKKQASADNAKSSTREIELKIGLIKDVKEHPNADKLLILRVSFGSEERTIVAGLRKYYTKEQLINKKALFVTSLEPAELRGIKSEGMILAAASSEDKSKVIILSTKEEVPEGSIINLKDGQYI